MRYGRKTRKKMKNGGGGGGRKKEKMERVRVRETGRTSKREREKEKKRIRRRDVNEEAGCERTEMSLTAHSELKCPRRGRNLSKLKREGRSEKHARTIDLESVRRMRTSVNKR